ncbi:response regulator transcription factor [Streptomyces sp. NPDC096132]|uniref:response regulator transcription factor n=1 Tax=Streptomyces sp. NPDC096132 TaxID=3366075 RepID=UPI003827305B
MADYAAAADVSDEEGRIARWQGAVTRARLLPDEENELLRLVALGYTNACIARKIFLSERTVGSRLRRLARELGLESRDELVIVAACSHPPVRDGHVCRQPM